MALLLLVAAVVLVVLRSHKTSPSGAHQMSYAAYSFAPEQYRDGLLIVRRWTLGGKDGSLLTETVTARSSTGKNMRARFEEVISAAIAPTLQTVRFHPIPAKIVQADAVVEWDLRLPARGAVTVGYQARVPAAGATTTRLARWATDLTILQEHLSGEHTARHPHRSVTSPSATISPTPTSAKTPRAASAALTRSGAVPTADGRSDPVGRRLPMGLSRAGYRQYERQR